MNALPPTSLGSGVVQVAPAPVISLRRAISARAWWETPACWFGLALLSTLPVLLSQFPMMPDLFGHLARFHVMNFGDNSPTLARYYRFRWVLIGNMGADLLAVPLGRLFGTMAAGRIIAAFIPALSIASIYVLATARGGRPGLGALLAVPLIWSFGLAFGFINYCLSLPLAFFATAAWIRMIDARWLRRAMVFAPVAAVVWLCHVAGWGVMCVMIGGVEFARGLDRQGFGAEAFIDTARRCLPIACPIVFIATGLIVNGAPAGPIHAELFGLGTYARKFWMLLEVVRNESKPLDRLTAVIILSAVGLMVVVGLKKADRGLLFAGLGVLACFLIFPPMMMGSWYADERLLPPGLILTLLAVDRVPIRHARWIALAAVVLFAGRMMVDGLSWRARSASLLRDVALADRVERGATIAVAAPDGACESWAMTGFDEAADLAVVRRDDFVTTVWNFSGYFLMHPIWTASVDPSIVDPKIALPRKSCFGDATPAFLAKLPRRLFRYVWLFETKPDAGVDWLRPIAHGPHSTLYRIVS